MLQGKQVHVRGGDVHGLEELDLFIIQRVSDVLDRTAALLPAGEEGLFLFDHLAAVTFQLMVLDEQIQPAVCCDARVLLLKRLD